MAKAVLRATGHNYGLIGPGCWETEKWVIHDNGTWSLNVSYVPGNYIYPDKYLSSSLNPETYEELLRLMNETWSDEKTEAFDGEAWEFSMYNSIGALVKHRTVGYVYEIEPFERIIRILKDQLEDNLGDIYI